MSFLGTLFEVGKTAYSFISGNGIGSQLARTVLTGLAIKKMAEVDQKKNNEPNPSVQEEEPDFGVRLQATADPSTKIPIVYGQARLGGKLTDVAMADNNQTMWYCLTLCEITGSKISDGAQSLITYQDISYNNSRVVFKADGITIDYLVDVNGKIDRGLSGLVKIYCYSGGSANHVPVQDYPLTGFASAWNLIPHWSGAEMMNSLVFVIVKVSYNAERNTSGLGTLIATLNNSMDLPGDVLYDMLTNTRYGAGIDPADIKAS